MYNKATKEFTDAYKFEHLIPRSPKPLHDVLDLTPMRLTDNSNTETAYNDDWCSSDEEDATVHVSYLNKNLHCSLSHLSVIGSFRDFIDVFR